MDQIVVKDTIWFQTGSGATIGVVLCEGGRAFIGVGDGEDESYDKKCIIQRGRSLDIVNVQRILRHLTGGK